MLRTPPNKVHSLDAFDLLQASLLLPGSFHLQTAYRSACTSLGNARDTMIGSEKKGSIDLDPRTT